MSVFQLLQAIVPRRLLAQAASGLLALRGDRRRFGVDRSGHWLNIQPEATFVSPDVYTAYYAQVEAAVLDAWCAFDRPMDGNTIIDVGAGIGEDAVVFSKLVGPSGRVVAIEAHPGTFACLKETIARSGLSNVVTVQCAIADREGVLTMSDDSEHLANSVLKGGCGVDVPAKTLDALLSELGIDDVDLLKMNIEGAERPAMTGIESSVPGIRKAAISCHDFVADAGNGGEDFRTRDFVRGALEAKGFKVRQRADAAHPWLRDTLYASQPV